MELEIPLRQNEKRLNREGCGRIFTPPGVFDVWRPDLSPTDPETGAAKPVKKKSSHIVVSE